MQVKEKKRQQEEAKMEENTYGELAYIIFVTIFSIRHFENVLMNHLPGIS